MKHDTGQEIQQPFT